MLASVVTTHPGHLAPAAILAAAGVDVGCGVAVTGRDVGAGVGVHVHENSLLPIEW